MNKQFTKKIANKHSERCNISPIFLISSLHNFPENWPGVISSERCEFSRETNLATYAAPRFANTDMPLKNLYVNIIV